MKLDTEFVRLPFRFDAERLAQDVLAFDDSDWMPHPQGFAGNTSIPLISLNGEVNDAFNGPMAETPLLGRAPCIRQVLGTIDEVFSRSRLMGLAAGCSVPPHRDINYHWYNRVRIHVPIITDPAVLFHCGDKRVHMAAGEAWIFDSWKRHHVENESSIHRTHLVIDTAGSARFWQLVAMSEWRNAEGIIKPAAVADREVQFDPALPIEIRTERFNAPIVMHPGEVDALVQDIAADMLANELNDPGVARQFAANLRAFSREWRRVWSEFGDTEAGWPAFQALINSVRLPPAQLLLASNQGSAIRTFSARILNAALNPDLATLS